MPAGGAPGLEILFAESLKRRNSMRVLLICCLVQQVNGLGQMRVGLAAFQVLDQVPPSQKVLRVCVSLSYASVQPIVGQLRYFRRSVSWEEKQIGQNFPGPPVPRHVPCLRPCEYKIERLLVLLVLHQMQVLEHHLVCLDSVGDSGGRDEDTQ